MNVTYLFGAGASFHALPIVEKIPEKILEQFDYIKFSIGGRNISRIPPFESDISDDEEEYLNDLKWLHNQIKDSASIDTYAKKLKINDKQVELYKLKNVFSAFLLIEQLKEPIDYRYESFFASILLERDKFPESLRILSWNYDIQLELAYQEFIEEENLYNAQKMMKVHTKHGRYLRAPNKFGVYKLNGTSIFYSANNAMNPTVYTDIKKKKISVTYVQEIAKSYVTFKKQNSEYISGLSFAWEDDFTNSDEDIITMACKSVSNTDILVIIGYSIPFFNREIDRKLLNEAMPNLKKIYFQSPEAEALIERFKSIRDDIDGTNLIALMNTRQFYLPNEL